MDDTILDLRGKCFEISDTQFGIKKHHSTVLCRFMYHECINHYLSHGSKVYGCLLDASKAIDRIHYRTLFYILIDRKVPFCIKRLLLDSYTGQAARGKMQEARGKRQEARGKSEINECESSY